MSDNERNTGAAIDELHLLWDPPHRIASLWKVYRRVRAQAEENVTWYRNKAAQSRRPARLIRGLAIAMVTVGGLQPLIVSIITASHPDQTLKAWFLQPVVPAVAIALAAASMGLDRFYGFSSTWMRSKQTEQRLARNLDAFHFGWEEQWARLSGGRPNLAAVMAMLHLCRDFSLLIQDTIIDETRVWVEEFSSALAVLSEAAQRPAGAPTPAAAAPPAALPQRQLELGEPGPEAGPEAEPAPAQPAPAQPAPPSAPAPAPDPTPGGSGEAEGP